MIEFYSQHGEDRMAYELLGSSGRLLDIGAFDGRFLSNSLALIKLGWSAVCVEASPAACRELIEVHRFNSRVRVVQAAITTEGGLASWHDNSNGLATTRHEHADRWAGTDGNRFYSMTVASVTPRELIDWANTEFDFISIDVEGHNLALLLALPFEASSLQRTKLLCVEHDGALAQMDEYLKPFGFTRSVTNSINGLWRRE